MPIVAAVEVSDLTRRFGRVTAVDGLSFTVAPGEIFGFLGILHGMPHGEAWQRAPEILATFALGDVARIRAGRLSGGMRRRLDLALALVHRPKVLFLFLTTQYLEEADRACDRVAIIDRGTLVAEGSPEAVKGGLASLDEAFLARTGHSPEAEPPARRAVSGIFAAAHGHGRRR
jgi:ABC-2 type transport system ATP-binding protein